MVKSPVFCEILEQLGCELGALVRPDNIWCSCATEGIEEGSDEVRGGGAAAHVNDVGPVSVAVDDDKEVLSCI